MATKEFDNKFQLLTKEMIEISYELLNFSKNEVEKIFVLGSVEDSISFNFFYLVNGKIVTPNKVNQVYINEKFDVSNDRVFALLDLGNKCLESLINTFKEDNRDVPTLIKIMYDIKTGKFESRLSYDLQYSNSEDQSFWHVYMKWIDEEKVENEN